MRAALGLILVLALAGLALAAAPKSETVDLSKHFADTSGGCFVMLDLRSGTTIRYKPERCALRFPPCSTFKIPNSMIGLDTGVVRDLDHVFKWDGTVRSRDALNQDQTLRSAVRDSVVWVFQELAGNVGQTRMQKYVDGMSYGNRDLSGGVTKFWLENSMKISADEQIEFLRRLLRDELPFSKRTMELGRAVIVLDDQAGNVFRGKTGSGNSLGWFVGTVTGPRAEVVFAANASGPGTSGPKLRKITEAILAERGIWPPPAPKPAP
jgi:beta-lactamase class D